MRRIPLNPIAPGSANGGIIIAPPVMGDCPETAPGRSGDCDCSDLGATWATGDTTVVTVYQNAVKETLIGHGGRCADTVWSVTGTYVYGDPSLDGDVWSVLTPISEGVDPPEVVKVADNVWTVEAMQPGIYTGVVSALCAGETIEVASVILVAPGF